jgi:octopine/nopaline transport system permease protein
MIEPGFVVDAFLTILPGVPRTLGLALVSFALGGLLAVPVALMRMSPSPLVSWPARLYVIVFRGTPLLLQLFLIYYGLAQFDAIRQSFLWPYFRDPYFCAILALTLNMAAYASEAVRGGLMSVAFGQIEAAQAAGMSRGLVARRIILPLAFRQSLPAFGNELIIMLKSTSLASIIAIMEVTGLASRLIAETYRVVEVLFAAGAIYLFMTFVSTRLVHALEAWLSPRPNQHSRPDFPLMAEGGAG